MVKAARRCLERVYQFGPIGDDLQSGRTVSKIDLLLRAVGRNLP